MKLTAVVETSRRVRDAGGRLEKVGLIASLLRAAPPDEAELAAAYLCGSPRRERLGVGHAVLRDAMPGSAPEVPSLELRDVDAAFAEIARTSGAGSAERRRQVLGDLLGRATNDERQFLHRLLIGELRQGALEGVVTEAVAKAAGLPAGRVRRAAMLAGDLPGIARAALVEGEAALSAMSVQLFRPVLPMLAGTAADEGEALAALGRAAIDFKLDGARVQVHKSGDEVRVFSRRLNDVTVAVPELVEAARALPVRDLILDGEAIALRPDGTPHPFQTTMRRFGRRLDVERLRSELPITPVFFDLLYLDGSPLLDEPLERRLAELGGVAPGSLLVPRLVTASPDEAGEFLSAALRQGHEGVMAKALDAPYEAGQRGARWLKVKPAHTLDLVVLAAEWGHGRRRGWLSNLHLGARDPATGGFVMLGKTFKGMTDRMLAWQTAKLLELELARDDYTVYVRPELVVEVAFNDVQASPQYPGGLALRFARVKCYREDKSAADADTLAAVRKIHDRSLSRASRTPGSPPAGSARD
ncbi:MAG TPA: ATP-dependent DNA ligase [Gemmatimonadales bacterium]|nr:ATP-dependent DNA ligase [Gemmatimonadales bacterium]